MLTCIFLHSTYMWIDTFCQSKRMNIHQLHFHRKLICFENISLKMYLCRKVVKKVNLLKRAKIIFFVLLLEHTWQWKTRIKVIQPQKLRVYFFNQQRHKSWKWRGEEFGTLKHVSLVLRLFWAGCFKKQHTQEKLWKPRSYPLISVFTL